MLLGGEKIDEVVASLRARLETDAEHELAEVDEVFVIAAVHYGTTDDGNSDIGSLFYRCTSARTHVQLGLIEQARRAVEANMRRREE